MGGQLNQNLLPGPDIPGFPGAPTPQHDLSLWRPHRPPRGYSWPQVIPLSTVPGWQLRGCCGRGHWLSDGVEVDPGQRHLPAQRGQSPGTATSQTPQDRRELIPQLRLLSGPLVAWLLRWRCLWLVAWLGRPAAGKANLT